MARNKSEVRELEIIRLLEGALASLSPEQVANIFGNITGAVPRGMLIVTLALQVFCCVFAMLQRKLLRYSIFCKVLRWVHLAMN